MKKIIEIFIIMLVINGVLGLYFHPCGWIERGNGATSAIWNPGGYIVQGMEGFGFYKVDERGYLNPKFTTNEIEYLVVGASHTQGKEVLYGNRYTDILNKKAGKNTFYNISQDGLYFPEIAKGFTALVSEFPNTKGIIIEIGSTTFDSNELQVALEQREFKEKERGDNILKNMSFTSKMKLKIKEYTPLLSIIKKQLQLVESVQKAEMTEKKDIDLLEYENSLNSVLKQMKEIYQGKIMIAYHPTVFFQKNGKLLVVQEETDAIFEKCCALNDIEFLNMSSAFLEAYEKEYVVPYGFMNTTMGSGHLNRYGHQIMADEIWKELNG